MDGGVVVLAAGQSEAKPVELAIASQLLFSRHVSWSPVGLAPQTWLLQLLWPTRRPHRTS